MQITRSETMGHAFRAGILLQADDSLAAESVDFLSVGMLLPEYTFSMLQVFDDAFANRFEMSGHSCRVVLKRLDAMATRLPSGRVNTDLGANSLY